MPTKHTKSLQLQNIKKIASPHFYSLLSFPITLVQFGTVSEERKRRQRRRVCYALKVGNKEVFPCWRSHCLKIVFSTLFSCKDCLFLNVQVSKPLKKFIFVIKNTKSWITLPEACIAFDIKLPTINFPIGSFQQFPQFRSERSPSIRWFVEYAL